ncbi:MAG: bifunctional nuclease family protein [Planctomycetes bacterium]|nr:bifunctional nuclease family protein [Planctomycetota bacterium]
MKPVECELARILINESADAPQMVMLREKHGERSLPIMIGIFEAISINRKLSGEEFPRPMTHDLFTNALERLGVKLLRITVSDMRHATYFGILTLQREDGSEIEVDARPSDAIALAVRTGCPIFVAEHVLEEQNHAPE